MDYHTNPVLFDVLAFTTKWRPTWNVFENRDNVYPYWNWVPLFDSGFQEEETLVNQMFVYVQNP